MEEKQIRLAAAWIYRNKHVGYWTFPALLAQFQPDGYVQSLRLSENEAFMIFQALEDKSFLKKIDGEFLDINGAKLQKYRLNWDKVSEFREFASLGRLERHLPESVYSFLKRWEKALIACAIIIATAFVQSVVEELGSALGAWISSLIPK